MADPPQNPDADVVVLRNGNQASRINEADVTGGIARNGHLQGVGAEWLSILQAVQPVRRGHHLIDHCFRFFRNSVDDVIDTDGLRDVVNEKE